MEQPTLSFKQFDHDQNTSILCIIVVDAAGTLRLYGPLAKIAQDVWLLPTMAAISKSIYGCLAINKDKDKDDQECQRRNDFYKGLRCIIFI